VSRNENFEAVAQQIADAVQRSSAAVSGDLSIDQVKTLPSSDGTVGSFLNTALTKLGEVCQNNVSLWCVVIDSEHCPAPS
jgi:hypothetical protein